MRNRRATVSCKNLRALINEAKSFLNTPSRERFGVPMEPSMYVGQKAILTNWVIGDDSRDREVVIKAIDDVGFGPTNPDVTVEFTDSRLARVEGSVTIESNNRRLILLAV